MNELSVRLAIPVEDAKGLNARLSQHFGRAPYFVVVELDEDGKISNLQMVPIRANTSAARGNPQKSSWA